MDRIFVRRIFEIIISRANVCARDTNGWKNRVQRTSGWMPGEAKGRGVE